MFRGIPGATAVAAPWRAAGGWEGDPSLCFFVGRFAFHSTSADCVSEFGP